MTSTPNSPSRNSLHDDSSNAVTSSPAPDTTTTNLSNAALALDEETQLHNEPAPTPTTPTSGQAMEENLVSRHPDATIPESDISLADISRRQSHPVRTTLLIILGLAALIAPYWAGRYVGSQHTAWVIEQFGTIDPRAIALVSWSSIVFAFASLAMLIIDRLKALWFTLFIVLLCIEQFISGLAMLRFDFWNSTYVMYGSSANIANAANLGILSAMLALAIFAVVWVGLLITIRKDSPLNVLTHVWASLILYFAIELIALLVVLFGGFLTVAS